ncbi:MAG: non-hydrolyzing UDP-N-acetylglucosamine 2-epimerase [bacterium]
MILLAFGTRPEYIKIKPLIDVFNKEGFPYKTLFTGQHPDLLKSIEVDYKISIFDGELSNRLDSIIQSTMNGFFLVDNITHVLVQGDTTSVLAVALAAFHRNIKVIHLEAGLRTYDNQNPYPEEQNRRLVSQITDVHLCPTAKNFNNLINERINGRKFVVGNTVLDNLLHYKKDCEYTNKVLVTMHRRENHHWMDQWFNEINNLADMHLDLEFIIPLHPNPNVQKYKHLLENVRVVNPMSHDELVKLLIKTKMVITDSGGIQEESSFFNKKCLTCRKITERPEAIGKSTIMVKEPSRLKSIFNEQILNPEINFDCPFGDGRSSEKIYNILKEII